MKTGVKVHDAMSLKPVTVEPDWDIRRCAKFMLKKRVGSLIVIKDKKMVGLITEKDIVNKVVAKGRNPKLLRAKSVMTKRVKTIVPSADLYDAMKIMKRKKIRRLPVVYKKELVGMLTLNDILKMQPFLFDYMKEKFKVVSVRKKKEKYTEGICEMCGNYSKLHESNGQYVCGECMDEAGEASPEE